MKLICPVDGCVLALAGPGFELEAQRCPKCAGKMDVMTGGEGAPENVSLLTPQFLTEALMAASPIALELIKKARNLNQGVVDVRLPLAHAIALCAVCCDPAGNGWRPHEMIEAVIVGGENMGKLDR